MMVIVVRNSDGVPVYKGRNRHNLKPPEYERIPLTDPRAPALEAQLTQVRPSAPAASMAERLAALEAFVDSPAAIGDKTLRNAVKVKQQSNPIRSG